MTRQRRAWTARAALLALACAGSASAHDLQLTEVLALLRTDRTYQVDVRCDLDALLLGVGPGADSNQIAAEIRALPPERFEQRVRDLQALLLRRVHIRFDDQEVAPQVSFPDYGSPLAIVNGVDSVLGLTARFAGRIPDGARTLTFSASRSFPRVLLTILDQQTLSGQRLPLGPATENPPFELGRAPPPARLDVIGRYLVLGFWHIVPEGLDHILFVLGLFLLNTRLRDLLWQVSAFTVAHTCTLGLAVYGVIGLPASVVEPLIALSIAYVAFENILLRDLRPWRPALVFGFGLLHGMGFAGVLESLGLPSGELAAALLSFNLGVELGQLAVIAAALLLVGWFRSRAWYRTRVTVPVSALIAVVGLHWSIARAGLYEAAARLLGS